MARFDFAVIGGGPAGASAARRLAQSGASVALFERRRMPRPKPCGGALSVRAMAYLDFAVPPTVVDAEVWGARLHFGGASDEARLDRRIGYLVTRSKFDHFLFSKAEEAGARVQWQDVKAVAVRASEVAISTPAGDHAAACVIICEGAGQRLSRIVRPRDPPGRTGFCLAADVPVTSPDKYPDLNGIIDIHFGFPGQGYGWLFHHGTYYSVGIGGLLDGLGRPMDTFRKFASDMGLGLDGVRIRGHFIPSGGVRRKACADRLILAGDAAGWVDPFLGEGLPYAVRSGQLAAQAALVAASRGDFSRRTLSLYEDLCWQGFGGDLRAARRLWQVMNFWPSLFVRALASEEEILRRYLQVASTERSYKYFFRKMLTRGPAFWLRSRLRKTVRS